MKSAGRKFTLLLGIPASILLLYFAVRRVDINQTIIILLETNYIYLFPAMLAVAMDISLRALRWKVLLSPLKKCRYRNILSITFIGFFANNILPMRAGELVRLFMLGEKEKISKSSTIATLILERILDVVAILLILSATFFIFPYPENIKKVCFIVFFIFISVTVFFYGLMFFKANTLKLLNIILKILPFKIKSKIEHILESFIDGLEILKKTPHLFLTIIISLLVWLMNATVFFLIARGMNIQAIHFSGAIFMTAVIALGISVPSSPGFIGIYEYCGILACTILGVAKSSALSYILLAHALQLFTLAIIGVFFLTKAHISLFQLGKNAENDT